MICCFLLTFTPIQFRDDSAWFMMSRFFSVSFLQGQTDNRKQVPTLSAQFRLSLDSLMKALSACQPFFIRCFKPNNSKQSAVSETLQLSLIYHEQSESKVNSVHTQWRLTTETVPLNPAVKKENNKDESASPPRSLLSPFPWRGWEEFHFPYFSISLQNR